MASEIEGGGDDWLPERGRRDFTLATSRGAKRTLDLQSGLRIANTTRVRQRVFARASAMAHEHAGELDGVVDGSCRAWLALLCYSSLYPYHCTSRRIRVWRGKKGHTDKQLISRLLARRQRTDVVVALLRHFGEGVVEVGEHGRGAVVGCREEHGLHLEFERAVTGNLG